MTTPSSIPTPADRLNRIVTDGLCIGCGLCQEIAGDAMLRVVETEERALRPVATPRLTHEAVDAIYRCCPGVRVVGRDPATLEPDTDVDAVWGPWRRAALCHASDASVRFEGSTGGALTALAQFLLESGRAAFVYHVKAASSEPTFGEAHVSHDAEDARAGAGSRYGPTAMLLGFRAALDRGAPFAFIGKPCDISAAKAYGEADPRVGALVRYWLAMVCGGYMPAEGMDAFLAERGFDRADLTRLRYRGRGCPGPTTVATAERSEDFSYLDFWGDGSGGWILPWRCKVCPDGIGEAADVAASDTWIGGSPTEAGSKTDLGWNAAILRSKAGQELFEAAVAAGALTEGDEVSPETMSAYQPHQEEKKRCVWARLEGMKDAGAGALETEGLRIEELARRAPEAVVAAQREGTRERVRRGRNAEPTPRPRRADGA